MYLSEYAKNLCGEVGERYAQKVKLCDNVDPFTIDSKTSSREMQLLPRVTYLDAYNYLVFKTSFYTHQSLSAFKSLESYKLYENGWVRDMYLHRVDSKTIVIAKVFSMHIFLSGNSTLNYTKIQVSHSQRLNLKPLHCWVLCKNDGEVICAHCICIAGLGEVCTHVGAVLFAVESLVRTYETVR